jgi:hypothetical protein
MPVTDARYAVEVEALASERFAAVGGAVSRCNSRTTEAGTGATADGTAVGEPDCY